MLCASITVELSRSEHGARDAGYGGADCVEQRDDRAAGENGRSGRGGRSCQSHRLVRNGGRDPEALYFRMPPGELGPPSGGESLRRRGPGMRVGHERAMRPDAPRGLRDATLRKFAVPTLSFKAAVARTATRAAPLCRGQYPRPTRSSRRRTLSRGGPARRLRTAPG
jgi:hypothetical protein